MALTTPLVSGIGKMERRSVLEITSRFIKHSTGNQSGLAFEVPRGSSQDMFRSQCLPLGPGSGFACLIAPPGDPVMLWALVPKQSF